MSLFVIFFAVLGAWRILDQLVQTAVEDIARTHQNGKRDGLALVEFGHRPGADSAHFAELLLRDPSFQKRDPKSGIIDVLHSRISQALAMVPLGYYPEFNNLLRSIFSATFVTDTEVHVFPRASVR